MKLNLKFKFDFKKFFNPVPDIGGLEISDLALRYAQINEGGMAREASVQLPPGVIIAGKIQDKEKLAAALAALHNQIEPLKKPVHVILDMPANAVATQTFSMPLVPEKSLKETAELNLQSVSPIDMKTAYYGYQIFGESKPGQLEGLGAFVPTEEVDQWTAALKEANFKLVAVEFPAFSLARLVKEYGVNLAPGVPYLVIHLLADGPDLMIVKDGNLYFNYFNSWKSLQEEVGGKKKIETKDVQDFLANHLKQILNFYSSRWGASINKVLIVNNPIAKQVGQTVKDVFGLEVDFLTIGKFGQISSLWYTALGAAARGRMPRSQDKFLSLTGVGAQEEFYRELTLNFIGTWRNVIAVVLASMFLVLGVADLLLVQASRGLERDLSARHLTSLAEIQDLQSNAQKFNQAVDFSLKAQEISIPWSPLLERIRSLAGSRISIDRFYVDTNLSALFIGRASNDSAVILFKNAIDKQENFTDVVLPLSNIKVNPNGSVAFNLNFKITSLDF